MTLKRKKTLKPTDKETCPEEIPAFRFDASDIPVEPIGDGLPQTPFAIEKLASYKVAGGKGTVVKKK